MNTPTKTDAKTARIRELNDLLRTNFFSGGKVMITSGIAALKEGVRREVISAVQTFSDFIEDNDPHGEHDFGAVTVDGHKVFWKIDYYAPDMMHGSEDPSDPRQTVRVLTIMLASEY